MAEDEEGSARALALAGRGDHPSEGRGSESEQQVRLADSSASASGPRDSYDGEHSSSTLNEERLVTSSYAAAAAADRRSGSEAGHSHPGSRGSSDYSSPRPSTSDGSAVPLYSGSTGVGNGSVQYSDARPKNGPIGEAAASADPNRAHPSSSSSKAGGIGGGDAPAPGMTGSTVPKRQRIPRACDSCRRKKVRCNLSQLLEDVGSGSKNTAAHGSRGESEESNQICANCRQSGIPCTFTKSPAKRGPNKGYIQQLENRLAALESTVQEEGGSLGDLPHRPTSADHLGSHYTPSVFASHPSEPAIKKIKTIGGLPAVGPIAHHFRHSPASAPVHRSAAEYPSPVLQTRLDRPGHLQRSPASHLGHVDHHRYHNQAYPEHSPDQPSASLRGSPSGPHHDLTTSPHPVIRPGLSAHHSYPLSAPAAAPAPVAYPRQSEYSSSSPLGPSPTSNVPGPLQKSALPPISRLLSQIPSSPWERGPASHHHLPYHGAHHYPPGPSLVSPYSYPDAASDARRPPFSTSSRPPLQSSASRDPDFRRSGTRLRSPDDDGGRTRQTDETISTLPGEGSSAIGHPGAIGQARPGTAESRRPSSSHAPHHHHLPPIRTETAALDEEKPNLHALSHPHTGSGSTLQSSLRGKRSSSVGSLSTPLTRSPTSPAEPSHARHRMSAASGRGTGASTPASLLGRLDRSAILSLDSLALRKALFATPAMRTFALLPPSMLEAGLGDSYILTKAAYQLTSSTASIQYAGSAARDDNQWQLDLSDIIGQCMKPIPFMGPSSELMCREIEALLLCYVDAVRRGRYIAGILGSISGKLAVVEMRGVDVKRYNASLTLLAVWHTVGFSNRVLYHTVPRADRPDDIYDALETDDPLLRSVCIFTGALDSMCRRYSEGEGQPIATETLELALPAVIEHNIELPARQTQLLATLDSFLLLLNFVYNQRQGHVPPIEVVEKQRHHLYNIINEYDACGATTLAVGPHIFALAAVATVYCLAACGDLVAECEQRQQARNRRLHPHALHRDYLAILDSLKHITTSLAAPPDASLLNSYPFADSGDMRLLYGSIADFIKVHVSAAIHGKSESLSSSKILASVDLCGYLGFVLAVTEQDAAS